MAFRRREALARAGAAALAAIAGGPPARALAALAGNQRSGDRELPAPDRRPDFVVIVLDDMRASDWAALRKTRRALAGGTTFPNYIVDAPLCAPSRAGLLTGMYTHNHGVRWNESDPPNTAAYSAYRQRGLDRKSIPWFLQQAGYRTGMFGKFMNGYGPKTPRPAGWDRFVAAWNYRYTKFTLLEDGKETPVNERDYITDVLGDYARRFIAETPFEQAMYLHLAPLAPHTSTFGVPEPDRRYANADASARVRRTPAYNEADVSDKPTTVRARPSLTLEQQARIDTFEGLRLSTLRSADDMIASVVLALKQRGKMHNTCIFVLSDNGFMMGEHRMDMGKAVPYTGACQVPMLAWGRPFGKKVDKRLVANIDIAPTIASLAGVRLPAADGFSLVSKESRDYVHIDLRPQYGFEFSGHGLRSRQLLYYEYANGEREFYDLRNDPMELSNLWPPGMPAPPAPGGLPGPTQLSSLLRRMDACRGTGCR
ncbi:MAG: sulfatase [Chloroflexota bacterium]